MDEFTIGINILKQFLFGICYFNGSWSICLGPFSVEIHPGMYKECGLKISFYNDFSKENS